VRQVRESTALHKGDYPRIYHKEVVSSFCRKVSLMRMALSIK